MSDINIAEYATRLLENDPEYEPNFEHCLPAWGKSIMEQILSDNRSWLSECVWRFCYDEKTNGFYIVDASTGLILTDWQICLDSFINGLYDFYITYDDIEICHKNYEHMVENRERQKSNYYMTNKKSEIPLENELTMVGKSYVYLIYSTSGHYKIGHSYHPKKRMKQLRDTIGPFDLTLVKQAKVNKVQDVEKYLHNKFSEHRVKGEWFLFDNIVLQEVFNEYDKLS